LTRAKKRKAAKASSFDFAESQTKKGGKKKGGKNIPRPSGEEWETGGGEKAVLKTLDKCLIIPPLIVKNRRGGKGKRRGNWFLSEANTRQGGKKKERHSCLRSLPKWEKKGEGKVAVLRISHEMIKRGEAIVVTTIWA